MSKGSHRRPGNDDQYRKNYAFTFTKCDEHPNYKAEHPPTADCIVCRRLWREAELAAAEVAARME